MTPASSRRRDQYGTSADETLLDQYLRLRQHTQALVARLNHEDMAVAYGELAQVHYRFVRATGCEGRLVRGQHVDQR